MLDVLKGLLICVLVGLIFYLFAPNKQWVSGIVFDCETQQPIVGAKVWTEQRGWGFQDGTLVWDKAYLTETTSSDDGKFEVSFQHGSSAHLKAVHEGSMIAEGWAGASEQVRIGLKRGKSEGPWDTTIACRFIKECWETAVENGVSTTRSICPLL